MPVDVADLSWVYIVFGVVVALCVVCVIVVVVVLMRKKNDTSTQTEQPPAIAEMYSVVPSGDNLAATTYDASLYQSASNISGSSQQGLSIILSTFNSHLLSQPTKTKNIDYSAIPNQSQRQAAYVSLAAEDEFESTRDLSYRSSVRSMTPPSFAASSRSTRDGPAANYVSTDCSFFAFL